MDNYEIAFQIILRAGNSKSCSMMAIESARDGKIEEAQKSVLEANDELNEAHLIQTEVIQKEASGEGIDVNIIMVHAQDHLTMAMMMKDVANEMIRLYTLIHDLNQRLEA